MRIACLPIGDLQTPSTWYRIGQYLPFFERKGVNVTFLSRDCLPSLQSFDLVINQKNLCPKNHIRHDRVVFDFDDALWTRPIKPYCRWTQWRINKRFNDWLRFSKCTLVANQYLAQEAKNRGASVSIIPMALDLNLWKPGKKQEGLIGWSGAPHNHHYLQKIEGELSLLLSKHPHIRFTVYSGKKPQLHIPFEYVPFKKGDEHHFIQKLSIGLLPLDNDPYSCGKSPIKALQYLACGIPVVTNAKGAPLELLEGNSQQVKTSWYTALESLLEDSEKQVQFSIQGKALIQEKHNLNLVAPKFLEQLKQIL